MTREDIIAMAREAGAMFEHIAWVERDLFPVFARFAELVAAAEREECAKLAEQTVCDTHLPTNIKIYGSRAAKAIRARGQA